MTSRCGGSGREAFGRGKGEKLPLRGSGLPKDAIATESVITASNTVV